jgi:hypothetical protein
MKLDPHPVFHNTIAFEYWFGLINFAKARQEKALFSFFGGLIVFTAARPYWVVEVICSLLLKSLRVSDC